MSQGIRRAFIELFSGQPFTKVVIPIIQRDYAQGRESAKDVRALFLESLCLTLERPEGDPKLPLDLDFVYGCLEGDDQKTFSLLDGQQRLTTLFLLHWYLAMKDGKSENFRSRMLSGDHSRFSYMVRPSSQEFCDALVKHGLDIKGLYSGDSTESPALSSMLQNEPWFFLSWRQDPTIASSLEMLDAIHAQFKDKHGFYDKLIRTENPYITFQFLNLHDFGLSDDLYIKMNSRGKPLTTFEVFKAQLEQVIKRDLPDQQRSMGDSNMSLAEYFSRQMDITWSDLFWRYRDKETHIFDRQIMNFIRGVALVMFASEHNQLPEEETNRVLELLADTKVDMGYLQYNQNDCLTKGFILALVNILDKLANGNHLRIYLNDDFYHDERDAFTRIVDGKSSTYTDWVQFYAYCAYLIQSDGEIDSGRFKDWMRLISNLARYTTYNRVDEFRQSIHAVKRLLDGISDAPVMDYVAKSSQSTFAGFNRQQAKEERLKAQLIVRHSCWNAIYEIERHGYFKGQIEFLLKFAGVLDRWSELEEKCSWDEQENDSLFQAFSIYANKAAAVFDGNGLRKFPDYLWERSLLTVGDYLLKIGRNHSFLDNTDRDVSWKRLLRAPDQSKDDVVAKREYVRILLDQINASEVESSLQRVISDFLLDVDVSELWRQKFVESPKCIEFCGKRQIRRRGDSVYLLRRVQMNGSHAELFTYHLKTEVLDQMHADGKFSPFDILDYWETFTDDDEPVVYMKRSEDSLYLQVDREEQGYSICLYHWHDDTDEPYLHDSSLQQALLADGLTFELNDDDESLSLEVNETDVVETILQIVKSLRNKYPSVTI